MWWIENGVTGVAVPTGKFVGMTSWNFHTREVKGPITLWTLNCLFLPWACLAMRMVTLGWVFGVELQVCCLSVDRHWLQ